MEFLRPKRIGLGLDMAPLIDVVFQLLIFFMLTSAFAHPALRLDLPKAATEDPQETEEIVVSVDRNGMIFLNSLKTTLEELRPELERRLTRSPKKSVHLRGDQAMPYGFFVQVMDLARQAGARQIHLAHEGKGRRA